MCLVEVADEAYLGLDLSSTSRAFETNDPVKLEVLAVLEIIRAFLFLSGVAMRSSSAL